VVSGISLCDCVFVTCRNFIKLNNFEILCRSDEFVYVVCSSVHALQLRVQERSLFFTELHTKVDTSPRSN